MNIKWYDENVPDALLPVSVTLFLVLFLSSKFSRLQQAIEEGALFLFGVRRAANKQLEDLALVILKHIDYPDALAALENASHHPIRLPRELLGEYPKDKFSFQLLQLAKAKIASIGFHEATLEIVNNHLKARIPAEEHEAMHLKALVNVERQRVYRVVVTYIMAAALYVLLVPVVADYFASLNVTWPTYDHIGIQIREMVVRGIAAFFPAVFGLLYIEKRWNVAPEAKMAIVFSTACIVFVWSMFVNLFHICISILQQEHEIQTTSKTSSAVLAYFPELIYVLIYSVSPAVVVIVLSVLRERGAVQVRKSIYGAVLFGLVFFLAQWGFELQAQWENKYYWHQGLLGVVLGFVTLMAAEAWRGGDSQ